MGCGASRQGFDSRAVTPVRKRKLQRQRCPLARRLPASSRLSGLPRLLCYLQVPLNLVSQSKSSDTLAQPKRRLTLERPSNDSERVEVLRDLNLLDTQIDPKFEDITRLVCTVFNVPIAAVTLVDKERLFFKSLQGLEYANNEMDRNEACFCSWTIAQKGNEVLVVEDASQDARCESAYHLDRFALMSHATVQTHQNMQLCWLIALNRNMWLSVSQAIDLPFSMKRALPGLQHTCHTVATSLQ